MEFWVLVSICTAAWAAWRTRALGRQVETLQAEVGMLDQALRRVAARTATDDVMLSTAPIHTGEGAPVRMGDAPVQAGTSSTPAPGYTPRERVVIEDATRDAGGATSAQNSASATSSSVSEAMRGVSGTQGAASTTNSASEAQGAASTASTSASEATRGAASPADPRTTGPALTARVPPRRPAPPINWEQWVGVRGAAVVGAAVLALAGILFFKYSVEHNLIPPPLRVAGGVLTGLACIIVGLRLPARYGITAHGITGAGLVILYAAFWAAHSLYALIDVPFTFALLALTTLTGGVLAVRRRALIIAVLGLVGGFATPLLLQSHTHSPFGLFGYILLLDIGVLLVARRLWPPLAILSWIATALYEIAWVSTRMHEDQVLVGLGVLLLFAVVYALGTPRQGSHAWRQTQILAIVGPAAGALYFALRADLGPHYYPIGGMLILLNALAVWVARNLEAFTAPTLLNLPDEPAPAAYRLFPSALAAANVTVYAAWCAQSLRSDVQAWEAFVLANVAVAVFWLGSEWHRARPPKAGLDPFRAARLGATGVLIVHTCVLGTQDLTPAPVLVGVLLPCLILARLGSHQAILQYMAAGAAAGVVGWHDAGDSINAIPWPACAGVWLGIACLWQALALVRRTPATRATAERAASLNVLVVLLFIPLTATPGPGPRTELVLTSGLAVLGALSATRAGAGRWLFAGVLGTAVSQMIVIGHTSPNTDLWLLPLLALPMLLFSAWPQLWGQRLRAVPWAWYTAAAAAPLWLLPVLAAWPDSAPHVQGGVVVLMACVTFAAMLGMRRAGLAPELQQRTLAWFGAGVLGLLSVAVPVQLEHEWLLVGWALEGLAVTVLWERLSHPGLKYFAAGLFAAVAERLILEHEDVFMFHPAGGFPVLNWLAYTYGICAACLLWSARTYARLEVARLGPWENRLYRKPRPWVAIGCGVAGLLGVFIWINLTIADAFGTQIEWGLPRGHDSARDLTLSVAWVVYALAILAVGVKQRSVALRWVSLGLLMVTMAKVFLYDLGQLQDLYRVASLVGLALSLLTVSLCYQRFVFAPLKDSQP